MPGGRLIIFDPGLSLLGRLVYGPLHPEPIGSHDPISWFAPKGWLPDQSEYYAAQGNTQRIFVEQEIKLDPAVWQLNSIKRLAAISYIASGGYSKPQLYPDLFLPVMRLIDRLCSLFPGLFTTRLLVVLERQDSNIQA
jgi:hypothetical protein